MHQLLNVLLRVKFSLTSMTLQMDNSVALRVHLKYVLEVFMEVCVILAGIKRPPRLCAMTNLEVDMVNYTMFDVVCRHLKYVYILLHSC